MKTMFVAAFLVLAFIIGLLSSGCDQASSPLSQNSGSVDREKQSIDKEPPGVHFLPRSMFNKWSGTQRGWDSKLCSKDFDTSVGSDSTTYGNTVMIWSDILENFDTMTVTVKVVDNTTFGAVDFFPSIAHFDNWPVIHLNYSNYGLTDQDAESLKIYWWDPDNNAWALISSKPAISYLWHCVKFNVPHFSRYAFGR